MPILQKVRNYLSLIKFSHTVFAMPFAMIGFTLAWFKYPHPSLNWPLLLIKVVLCMVFARSAAMAFNRYLDRRYDALNPRTAKREVPAGIITPEHALTFTIVNCLLFVITTYFINIACLYLSFIALFVILFYSYTKRFTALCHIVLGIGLSLSPIGAFLAVYEHFDIVPVLFSLSVITWVSGFDIIYALQDEEFDRTNKLHSIPAALGTRSALLVSTILHVFSAGFIIYAGIIGPFHWVYWLGAIFYVCMLTYQHLLVKPNDLSKVNMAFANTNGIASVIFGVFTILSLLL